MRHENKCRECTIEKNCTRLECTRSQVMWTGLSAKASRGNIVHEPLAKETNSGAIIMDIEKMAGSKIFHKTNLVKCAPLTGDLKTRYPTKHELRCCSPIFIEELETVKPKVVFLLGKMVADFVFKTFELGPYSLDKQYRYTPAQLNDVYFVPIHHPSFIRVYRYKTIETYQDSLINTIESYA